MLTSRRADPRHARQFRPDHPTPVPPGALGSARRAADEPEAQLLQQTISVTVILLSQPSMFARKAQRAIARLAAQPSRADRRPDSAQRQTNSWMCRPASGARRGRGRHHRSAASAGHRDRCWCRTPFDSRSGNGYAAVDWLGPCRPQDVEAGKEAQLQPAARSPGRNPMRTTVRGPTRTPRAGS